MNLGSIYLDFCEPIQFSEHSEMCFKQNPSLDPISSEKDRLDVTNKLGWRIVYELQDNIRIMPTTLLASILLLHRKGINEDDLEKKTKWLGEMLNQRGFSIV